jgi:hypothetical protein
LGKQHLPEEALWRARWDAQRRVAWYIGRPEDREAMIHDVDESLRALVKRDALNGTRVDIAFDAPTKDWAARQNAPSVNLYLYDIREDLQRREVAWEPRRDETGRVVDHRLPARRYRLSYLVTAWTQRPEDEHRLLSALLSAFLRHPVIPADVAAGALADSELPVYMTVALPPPDDRSIADVWSALGGELKPSLDLVVTAPMDVERRIDAAPPVIEHGLRVVGGGAVESANGGRGAARRAFHRPLLPADPASQEETILGEVEDQKPAGIARRTSGKADQAADKDARPGRRIRVRGISRP